MSVVEEELRQELVSARNLDVHQRRADRVLKLDVCEYVFVDLLERRHYTFPEKRQYAKLNFFY